MKIGAEVKDDPWKPKLAELGGRMLKLEESNEDSNEGLRLA
jgi:hypothetical protein